MMAIDFESPISFAPFFSARAEISGVRPNGVTVRGTYAVCLLFGGNADSLVDLSPENEATLLTVLLARRGAGAWNRQEPPQIGDIVKLSDGRKFAVKRCGAYEDTHYTLETREC